MQIKSNPLDGHPCQLIPIAAYPNRAYGGSEGGFATVEDDMTGFNKSKFPSDWPVSQDRSLSSTLPQLLRSNLSISILYPLLFHGIDYGGGLMGLLDGEMLCGKGGSVTES
jgi:hypothetical protein